MSTEISPFEHILVVLESSEDVSVPLARATRLCKATNAKITIFVSWHRAMFSKGQSEIIDDLGEIVEQQHSVIHQQLEKWQAREYLHKIILSWSQKPSMAVASLIEKHHFDLVLKAPYQQGEFKSLFRSGLDHYFVSDCPLPVWMVKPRLWDTSIEVLACVDMGDDEFDNHQLNKKILSTSDYLTRTLAGELHVVDCFYGEIGSMHIDYNSKRGFKREATIKEQHVEKLKLYIAEYSLSDDKLHLEEGIPDDALPDRAAALRAEVAVIGNNEDTNYIDKLFGDTAVTLTKAMPCDILVLKPDQANR